MLELAIAEAHRLRPRPPSKAPPRPPAFATNPNTRTSSSMLRSRPTSVLSTSSSIISKSWSLRGLLVRRKRSDSVVSENTASPNSTCRSDSVLNSTTKATETHRFRRSTAVPKRLPWLPASVPLPPQEELEEFDFVLQSAIDDLRDSSAVLDDDLAIMTLSHLAHAADITSCIATSWPELWAMLVHAANLLRSARPDTSVAITNVLAKSLGQVARRWGEDRVRGGGSRSSAKLARIAGGTIDEMVCAKRTQNEEIGIEFAKWLEKHCHRARSTGRQESSVDELCLAANLEAHEPHVQEDNAVRILSCAFSPTIQIALASALSRLPHIKIHLSIISALSKASSLASASSLSPSGSASILIERISASEIGATSQATDILLLDSDRVSAKGSFRSTVGALGACACTKMLSPRSKVVALGSLDNVVPWGGDETGARIGPADTEGGGLPYEWIPARFADVFVVERGVVQVGELEQLAKKAGELQRHVFGEDNI